MIIEKATASMERIQRLLLVEQPKSRFTWRMEIQGPTWRRQLKIYCVRLKRKKDYCGQHPGPCQVNPFIGPEKHPIAHWLEGLDWVGFDNMINDVLDKARIHANVWSKGLEFRGRYYIRKGCERRIAFPMETVYTGFLDLNRWDSSNAEDQFRMCIGRVRSVEFSYPDETPGIPYWRLRDEKKYAPMFVHQD